jgi:hypothetical protein
MKRTDWKIAAVVFGVVAGGLWLSGGLAGADPLPGQAVDDAAVVTYEDGSRSDGTCTPGGLCDDGGYADECADYDIDLGDWVNERPCGPADLPWLPVDTGLADALAEGDAPDATTRDWEACLVQYGPTTTVVCPDGWVEVS